MSEAEAEVLALLTSVMKLDVSAVSPGWSSLEDICEG